MSGIRQDAGSHEISADRSFIITARLRELLRISDEPYRYHREADIHNQLLLDPRSYFDFVHSSLVDIAKGMAQLELPPKLIFDDSTIGGDFRVMPCVVRHPDFSSKTVKLVGTNIVQCEVPNQITVGKAFALHPEENFITDVFEACLLSSARTGLCAAIATQALAPMIRQLTIIGAGRVGYYSARFIAVAADLDKIALVDLNHAQAARMAELLAEEVPGVEVTVGHGGAEHKPDLVVLATDSRQAVDIPNAHDASLLISLGADSNDQQELDPALAHDAEVYVDLPDSARCGDLRRWQDAGICSVDEIGSLLDLLAYSSEPRSEGLRIFVSTGSALFDNLTIAYLLKKGQSLGRSGSTVEIKSSNL